jgi:hypothetical protein
MSWLSSRKTLALKALQREPWQQWHRIENPVVAQFQVLYIYGLPAEAPADPLRSGSSQIAEERR